MPDLKISQLGELDPISAEDLFAVVDDADSTTKKVKFSTLTAAYDSLYLKLDASNDPITGVLTLNNDLQINADNKSILFGATQDAGITYDGTNMVFDSQLVGGGDFYFANGNIVLDTGYVDSKAYYYIDGIKMISKDGTSNLFIGESAGSSIGAGQGNTFIGQKAGEDTTTGSNNMFLGQNSGANNISGVNNSLAGVATMLRSTSASSNVAFGYRALFGVTNLSEFQNNIAIGDRAGYLLKTGGDNNILIGFRVGFASGPVTGAGNILIGSSLNTPATNTDDYLNIGNTLLGDLVNNHLFIPYDNSYFYWGLAQDFGISYTGLVGNIDSSLVAPSDIEITCGANKTIELINSVFDDMQFPLSGAKVPASNAPTWETFTANTNEYSFDVDDFIDTQANEMPHAWKEGTNGRPHLHVTTKAANSTGSDRFAKFTIWIAYNDTGELWQETSFTAELTIPTGTSALHMFYLDMGADLDLTNYILGAEIKLRAKRIAATGGTEYAGRIFLTQAGVHVSLNTLGSRQETVK